MKLNWTAKTTLYELRDSSGRLLAELELDLMSWRDYRRVDWLTCTDLSDAVRHLLPGDDLLSADGAMTLIEDEVRGQLTDQKASI